MNAKLLQVRAFERDEEATDIELLGRCARSDERALAALYRRHSAAIYRFASRLLGARSPELDDVVQAVFLTAWRRAGDFEAKASVKAWLFGIAANCVRDKRRSERRLLRLLTSFADRFHGAPQEPESQVMNRQLVDRIGKVLAELPHDLQVAYVMCEIEEVPGTEAAVSLGVKPGTMWRRLHDARKVLRTALEEETR